MPTTIIISRTLYADPQKADLESGVIALCRQAGINLVVTPHLYHIAEDSALWDHLRKLDGDMVLAMWLHPRPALALAEAHGLNKQEVRAYNLGAFASPQECFDVLTVGIDAGSGEFVELDAPVAERWYPVVDMERCVDCGHCLQFCLFGVHALGADGKVRVTYPDKCKPGCPACSRICPEGAIIFPLYRSDEAIAGAPGTLMQPDVEGRRMFYKRTGKPCPKCGRTANLVPATSASVPAPMGGAICEECGNPIASTDRPTQPSVVADELDALLNELDDISRSNP